MADLGILQPGTYANVADTTMVGSDPALEEIASADDADYVQDARNATHTGSCYFAVEDVPTDFVAMTTVSVQLRYARSANTANKTWDNLRARIYKSDGTTALTDSATLASSITTTTPTNSSVIAFTGVDTAATETEWNAARLYVYFDVTRAGGGNTNAFRVYAGELTGTYSTVTTVTGTAAGAGTSSGTASGTVTVLATAAGAGTSSGTASGTVTVPATAAGASTASGTAVATVTVPAIAAGAATSSGTASATVTTPGAAPAATGGAVTFGVLLPEEDKPQHTRSHDRILVLLFVNVTVDVAVPFRAVCAADIVRWTTEFSAVAPTHVRANSSEESTSATVQSLRSSELHAFEFDGAEMELLRAQRAKRQQLLRDDDDFLALTSGLR